VSVRDAPLEARKSLIIYVCEIDAVVEYVLWT
jgi:hypothetical protein